MKKLTLLFAILGIPACGDRVIDESLESDPFGGDQMMDNPHPDDPFGKTIGTPVQLSPPTRTTPPNFQRDFSLETTLSKLEDITFPPFETGDDIPLRSVLALIQSRSTESDIHETNPFEKGIHFEIWDWRRVKGTADSNRELSPYRPLSMAHDDERWMMGGVVIREENSNVGDLIAKVAAMSKMDVYLSSRGIVLVPEGEEPNPTKREDVTIWQRFPRAKE